MTNSTKIKKLQWTFLGTFFLVFTMSSQTSTNVENSNTPIKGNVDSVTVIENSPGNLKLALRFTEFNNHDYELVADLVCENRILQEQINSIKVNLKGVESPLILDFKLNSDVVLDSKMLSSFLELKVGPKDAYKELSFYKLNKRWDPRLIHDYNSIANVQESE